MIQKNSLFERDEHRTPLLDDIQLNKQCFEPEYNFLATRARFLLETNEGGTSEYDSDAMNKAMPIDNRRNTKKSHADSGGKYTAKWDNRNTIPD